MSQKIHINDNQSEFKEKKAKAFSSESIQNKLFHKA